MFHYKEQSILGLDDFVKLNNVRVLDYFQNVYLSGDSLNVIDIINLPLVEDLDSDSLTREHMYTLLDLAKRALTERLLYLIVANHIVVHVDFLFVHCLLNLSISLGFFI